MRAACALLPGRLVLLLAGFVLFAAPMVAAQSGNMTPPQNIVAGSAFSIPTTGSGKATLSIVGPDQVLRRDVQLGETASFPAGVLYNAGHYLAILQVGSSAFTGEFDVVPMAQPDTVSFLAKPSRLPVGQRDGISGTVYVFDVYHNLIVTPMPVSFDLATASGSTQTRTVPTRNGVAWTRMDSGTKEGKAKFIARVNGVSGGGASGAMASGAGISSVRVIEEVPGDPCGLTISARPAGNKVQLQTAPIRDCSGNPVPDGTIVTFTETYDGMQSTADVPIKKGIAQVEMPSHVGARISVASGVVAGNEIRWDGGR